MKKVYLTLASVIRDQEHYVREWLTFNHLIGVERMVIVLHKCSDRTEKEIRKLPFFEEKVRLHHVANDEQRVQMGAFRWMLDTYGPSTEWMLFTDADEFFFGTVENDLRTILARYDSFGGLAGHWHMFGASGRVQRPPMPSIKYFVERVPDDKFVLRGIKCAVKPRHVRELVSPHLFVTAKPIVREDYGVVSPKGIWQYEGTPMWNVVRCNHYCTFDNPAKERNAAELRERKNSDGHPHNRTRQSQRRSLSPLLNCPSRLVKRR